MDLPTPCSTPRLIGRAVRFGSIEGCDHCGYSARVDSKVDCRRLGRASQAAPFPENGRLVLADDLNKSAH